MVKKILVALSFLTIIPLNVKDISSQTLIASAAFFPLVGWIVGLFMAGCACLFLFAGIHPMSAAVLIVAIQAWLTRGLHLDGVADLCDGCAGSFDTKKRLAIMKDPSTGAFGVVGLVLVLLLKVSGITVFLDLISVEQSSHLFYPFLVFAFVPAASRWAMATLAWKSHYPRDAGTGHVFVGKVRLPNLVLGLCFLLPVFFVPQLFQVSMLPVALTLVLTFLPSIFLRFLAHAKFGGVTGDVLGASCEFGEALGWMALPMFVAC